MAVIADWIDAELRNWSAWCRSGAWPHPLPQSHCASIEHRYMAPSDMGAEVDAEEIARRIPIIRDRAEIVHRVYRERLTQREQRVLVVRYIRHVPDDQVHRTMRLPRAAVATATVAAAGRIGAAFRERHALRP